MRDVPQIPVYKEGPFSTQFTAKNKKIKPIVLSHGYTGNGNYWSGMCRDFASRGYIIFTPDHCDGSGVFTMKKDGTHVPLDTTKLFGTYDWINGKIDTRVSEISELITEFSESGFL